VHNDPNARLPTQIVNDKGRSHQQSQSPILSGAEFRSDPAHSCKTSETEDILKAVVAGKVREIAIVGDSVLYRSLPELASPQQGRGHLSRDGVYLLSSTLVTKCGQWPS
jgi:hypothetical protein